MTHGEATRILGAFTAGIEGLEDVEQLSAAAQVAFPGAAEKAEEWLFARVDVTQPRPN